MKEILELERIGYVLSLSGDKLQYMHNGTRPDPSVGRLLLDAIHRNRDEAVRFLRARNELAELRVRSSELAGRVNKGHDFLNSLTERGVSQDAPEYDRFYHPWEQLLREYEQVETEIAAMEVDKEQLSEKPDA